mgnify:CR=1 FL=1
MIHSASAGRSSNHMNLMCFYKAAVDFLFAILILPDDDGSAKGLDSLPPRGALGRILMGSENPFSSKIPDDS